MRPGHRGQRSASTSAALRSVVRARHCTCGHAGGWWWGARRLFEFEFGWFRLLHSGVGLLLFYCGLFLFVCLFIFFFVLWTGEGEVKLWGMGSQERTKL